MSNTFHLCGESDTIWQEVLQVEERHAAHVHSHGEHQEDGVDHDLINQCLIIMDLMFQLLIVMDLMYQLLTIMDLIVSDFIPNLN